MLKNGTVLGPLKEGQTLNVECEIRGARPAPTVGWFRSGKRLLGELIPRRPLLLGIFLFKYKHSYSSHNICAVRQADNAL